MNILNDINTFGFSKVKIISIDEQSIILGFIQNIFNNNLISIGNTSQSVFDPLDSVTHDKISNKNLRFLNAEQIDIIKNMNFFKILKNELDKKNISTKAIGGVFNENETDEEIYFRVVRPFYLSDVGVPHADAWYHDSYNPSEKLKNALSSSFKIWIPIFPDIRYAGLSILQNSNDSFKNYKKIFKGSGFVPSIDFSNDIKLDQVFTDSGELLIFHPYTIHCGVVNYDTKCRISVEITLI